MQTLVRLALTLVIASLAAAPVFAQPEPAHDASGLAKQTQNPVGDLISL